jgi:hypothetical protein
VAKVEKSCDFSWNPQCDEPKTVIWLSGQFRWSSEKNSLSDIHHLGALLEPLPSSFLTDEEDEETKTTPLWGPLGVKAPA